MCNNNHQRPCVCCVVCHHSTHPPCPPPSTHLSTTNNNTKDKLKPMRHHSTHHTSPVCCPLSCVPTQPHPSMLLCRPVCPKPAHSAAPTVFNHRHHTTHAACAPILRRSFLVCVQHTHYFNTTPHSAAIVQSTSVLPHRSTALPLKQLTMPCAAFHCPLNTHTNHIQRTVVVHCPVAVMHHSLFMCSCAIVHHSLVLLCFSSRPDVFKVVNTGGVWLRTHKCAHEAR